MQNGVAEAALPPGQITSSDKGSPIKEFFVIAITHGMRIWALDAD
jgi:hypothetical protein